MFAELAREAEEAGWDGAFYWDGINVGEGWETYDPWVVMAARVVRPFAEAGITWWMESMWSPPNEPDDLRARIRQGPPCID